MGQPRSPTPAEGLPRPACRSGADTVRAVQAQTTGALRRLVEQESELAGEYGPVSPESIRQMRVDYMDRVHAERGG